METINRNKGSVNLVDAIRTAIPPIVQNYGSPSIPKEVLINLIAELSAPKYVMERMYLMHYLMRLLSGFREVDAVRLFSSLLPPPLTSKVSDFMRQFVSLAVSLENKQILAAGSYYLDSEQIKFPHDLEVLPKDLVSVSPPFVAIVLTKGFFIQDSNLFTPDLIVHWLHGLISLPQNEAVPFNVVKLLEFVMIGKGRDDPKLHLSLMEVMEKKRIQQIPCQVMLSIARSLSNEKLDTQSKDMIVDRFCQILLVSLQCEVCSKFTPEVKAEMASLFPSTQFLLLILAAMN
jgi:hypothetical protein